MTTIEPRTFCTMRYVQSLKEYERIANLIKKYGCVVSKVSDGWVNANLKTVFYFEIPKDSVEAFLKEEQQ